MTNTVLFFIGEKEIDKAVFIEENDKRITSLYGVEAVLSSDAVIDDVAHSLKSNYYSVYDKTKDLANKYVDVMLGLLSLQQRSFIVSQIMPTKEARKSMLSHLQDSTIYNKIVVVFGEVEEYPKIEEGFNRIMTVEEFKAILPEYSKEEPKYGEIKFD